MMILNMTDDEQDFCEKCGEPMMWAWMYDVELGDLGERRAICQMCGNKGDQWSWDDTLFEWEMK